MTLSLFSPAQNLSDSLLLYYPFNGNAIDASGNGFDGFISGVTDTTDRFGNSNSAYYFDGVDDYIELPNISELKPTDFPISFSFWVKLKDLTIQNGEFFSTDYMQNNYHGTWMNVKEFNDELGTIAIGFGGGLGGCGESNRKSKRSGKHVEKNTWHHIIGIIRDYNDMSLYIDCSEGAGVYSGEGSQEIAYTNTPGRIGTMDANTTLPAHFYWGFMDDFAFWNRELSLTEISDLCLDLIEIDDSNSSNIYENNNISFINTADGISIKSNVIGNFSFYNMEGKLILKKDDEKSVYLEKSTVKNGIYILMFIDKKGNTSTTKISLIQH